MKQWNEARNFLVGQAAADLADGAEIRPCLVAFRGEQALFVAFLREFAKGAYDDPIIELLALAVPLGADRLALSVGARAWSMDDPIPPVVQGLGDLRQRVLCVVEVDATAGAETAVGGCVYPFTLVAGRVAWTDPLPNDGGEGWIVAALKRAVECRGALAASRPQIRRQARRCARVGHLLAFSPAIAVEVGLHNHPPVR